MPTYYVFCRRCDNLRDYESNAIYLYYELNKLHNETSTLVCDFGYPKLFTKIKLEKNIRNKIKENQSLFSYEVVDILEKIKEEIKERKSISEVTKNSYLDKVDKFIDFFDSNEAFFKSINHLVRKKLEDPENPDNEIYWTQALKAFSARLEKRINDNKKITSEEKKEADFIANIQPIIAQLIKVFLLHYEYFSAARYKAIAVCEELLVHNLQENNLHLKLLYMLANLHSYRGNYWRRESYKSKFDELKQQLNLNEDFLEIQIDEEAAHNGLRRLLHYMQNVPIALLPRNLENSGRRTDAYKLNVFSINLNIQNHKIVSLQDKDEDSPEEQISISRWNNIPDFAVLTGINGVGKTKILDSLNEELKRLYSVKDPRMTHHLYLDAESDILRNVFGKRGNDFKLEYVYEKLIFYLDFDDYKKRAIVNQRSEENLSCKIALAIADRIFCRKYEGDWLTILNNLKSVVGKTNKISLLKNHISNNYILQLAEELAFKLNAIVEPISFVKNICWQHLQLVKSKYKEHHPQILGRENNNYYDIHCSNYCESNLAIINPIKNINALLRKYLKDFAIEYKRIPYYKYRLLYDEHEQPDFSEIGLFLENNEHKCRIVDKDLPLTIPRDEISEEIYIRITEAIQIGLYINLDNEIEKIVEFTSSHGYTLGSYELIFLKDCIDIHPQNLSSGEITIIKLILWAYVSKGLNYNYRIHEVYSREKVKILQENEDMIGRNIQDEGEHLIYIKCSVYEAKQDSLIKLKTKIELLLLDEVDKHFDPKLSRVLINILRNDFVHEYGNSQVIITTHRLDTIALTTDQELFAIEKENVFVSVVKSCTKLLSIAKLSRNMQTYTGMHVKVYTESFDDAKFYEGIYANLMKYSNIIRENGLHKIAGANPFLGELAILSRRYQMGFYSASLEKGESGGHSEVKNIVRRQSNHILSEPDLTTHPDHYSISSSTLTNLFRAYKVDAPFGIIDRDYENNSISNGIKLRILKLNRHSLENYMYDPILIISLFKDVEELNEFIDSSVFSMHMRGLYRELLPDHGRINIFSLQTRLNELYKTIFDICIDYESKYLNRFKIKLIEKIKIKIKERNPTLSDHEIKDFSDTIFNSLTESFLVNAQQQYIDQKSREITFLAIRFQNPNQADRPNINRATRLGLQDLFESLKNLLAEGVSCRPQGELENVYNRIRQYKTDGYVNLGLVAKQIIVGNQEPSVVTISYPKSLIDIRGHDLEDALNVFLRNDFKNFVLNRILELSIIERSKLIIPEDLAQTIIDLNYKIKIQIIEKADYEKFQVKFLGLPPVDYSLKQTEKYIISVTSTSQLLQNLLQDVIRNDYKQIVTPQKKVSFQLPGTIILLLENNHILFHKMNILSIMEILDREDFQRDRIVCIERKQHGNNLGMSDVITLAKYIEQGNTLPSELQHLPIYYDSLLYNAAKAKGISVIGIEGKGLVYPKKSSYYHQAREKYMAEQLAQIAKSGKNAIFLVGSAHINNLIKFLSSQGFRVGDNDSSLEQNLITLKPDQSILTRELVLPYVSTDLIRIASYKHKIEDSQQFKTENLVHKKVQPYFYSLYIHKFAEQLDLNWQVQKLLHLTDLWKFELIKTKYGISASFNSFRGSNSDFRKLILLKLHPDKNPSNSDCNDDFVFVINLREELNKPFDVQKFIDEKIQSLQPLIYKANIGFKAFDTAIDVARLTYVPTADNAKKVLIDTTYIYSMYSGANDISIIINGVDIAYKVYQGEYKQALAQSLTTVGYMLIPAAISFVAIPYIGFVYGATLAIYSGYGAISNAYSSYQEYYEGHFGLRSILAYKTLFDALSNSPLQYVYDFNQKTKEYEIKFNSVKLESEKTHAKKQLEEKGEFGQKLYEYIYSRVIEEKYDLLNKLTRGILNQEDTEDLKAKHIKVMDYDHCIEIVELKEGQSDHYYCYCEEQQVLDHIIIIGNTYVEKIDSL